MWNRPYLIADSDDRRVFSGSRIMRHASVAILVWLLSLGVAGAQGNVRELEFRLESQPNDRAVLMELGRLYHDLGVAGDDEAVEKGFTCFDRLVALDSTNAIALVYRGSMWIMRAREAWWPPTKLGRMKKGVGEMDRAVEMDPGDLTVRLIRGMSSLDLPGYLDRLETALEDFIILLRHPVFPEQSRELKGAVFCYAGIAYKRAGEFDTARELFGKAIAILPGSDLARRAQQELSEIDS
jgi:tetratricopeptide (TPR) repeat protein